MQSAAKPQMRSRVVISGIRLGILIWLSLLLRTLSWCTQHTRELAAARHQLVEAPPLVELDARLLNILTLGHRGLYDDFINIWALQMLMDQQVRQQDPLLVHQRLMQIARHTPKIESFYMLSCFVLAIDFSHPELCASLIQEGLKAFPSSWRLPMTQGFMYAYKLQDRANAAIYYAMAAAHPDAPEFLRDVSTSLRDENIDATPVLQMSLDALLGLPVNNDSPAGDAASKPQPTSRLGDYLRRSTP